MLSSKLRLIDHIRLSFAIAGKDMLDAIKNKTILSQFGSLVFILVMYQFLPVLTNAMEPPRLCVYDPAQTQWVDTFMDVEAFNTIPARSAASMQDYVADRDMMVIGIALPPDFNQRVEAGYSIELQGYFAHWQSAEDVAEARVFFEQQLSTITGTSIRINTDDHRVYSRPNSKGLAFTSSLTIGLIAMIAGMVIVPNLLLEEKNTNTMDALLVSPAGAYHITVGKAMAGMFYTAAFAAAALILRRAIINVWWLAILAALSGTLFSVALGLLIGSMIENRQQLTLWVFGLLNLLILPGILVLMEELIPQALVQILRWTPTALLIKILIVSFGESPPLRAYAPELAVLLGMTLVLMGAIAFRIQRSDR